MINLNEGEKIVKAKRGRKSKKELAALALALAEKTKDNNSIVISIEEKQDSNEKLDNVKLDNENFNLNAQESLESNSLLSSSFMEESSLENNSSKPPAKKRGRKPKGGKILQQVVQVNVIKEEKPNVILHLKCSLKDLNTQNMFNGIFEPYHFSNKSDLNYNLIDGTHVSDTTIFNIEKQKTLKENNRQNNFFEEPELFNSEIEKEVENKLVWKKLKYLEHSLHSNNISDKKSACFWCTYDFDNPAIYIPKHYIKESYQVYGCFCSPECGVAFLMQENIDSSTKFERYHLLNNIYAKVYNYNKNIKPAPNPYYMLDKYYGNLTIQEYRSLLRNERFFLVVDKPLTRILPELHEDNEDHIISNKIIPTNNFQIKKKLQKKQQTKSTILNEKFGMQTQCQGQSQFFE